MIDSTASNLGLRVCIISADMLPGRIVEYTQYIDGSKRWGVQFWHNGSRDTINCRADELTPEPDTKHA